jgi:hypothetical protein
MNPLNLRSIKCNGVSAFYDLYEILFINLMVYMLTHAVNVLSHYLKFLNNVTPYIP